MSHHDDWKAAKKTAFAEFKEARKAWIKKQDKKIKDEDNEKQRRMDVLEDALGQAGLDGGESLSDYLKFSDGFGTTLDTLEKAVAKNNKLKQKYNLGSANGMDVDIIIANPAMFKEYLRLCKTSLNEPLIIYYMKDHKKPADYVYQTYVKDRAPKQVDLSLDLQLKADWAAAVQNNTLDAQGGNLKSRLRDHVKTDLDGDMITKFVSDEKCMAAAGFIPKTTMAKLKQNVRDTADKYRKEVKAAAKNWSKLQPKFWLPLDAALDSIVTYCDGLR